jgi:hypothetical protein
MKNMIGFIALIAGGMILFSSKKIHPVLTTVYADEWAGQYYPGNDTTA